ncbi:hypothetical protein [Mucilaginibacter psychrotolerans]|uniref:Uncharacterized protein n=1 Tax=Mucilaginibacter psychrotolerans TaxID=1524096 RepID=A0A4Y8SJ99_9SPHI|nr:hypothetical protein [Mucilaginibacter psychrotolerans]TFF39139.1 hypothetical protein E2R66_05815 [Mucilaginibacter psychrotolerans]
MRRVANYAMGCVAVLLIHTNSFGQNTESSLTLKESVIDNMLADYNSGGDQSRLFNSPKYDAYDKTIKGSAYFAEPAEFTNGNVEYDGFSYKNMQLMYDLNRGSVIMQLPNRSSMVELVSDRVQSFDIAGHHFVRLDAFSTQGSSSVPDGFYDVMYSGKTEFIVHRQKAMQAGSFSAEATSMYVKVDGTYKNFDSKKSLLSFFKDRKQELSAYIKDNAIEFDADKEQAVIKMVTFYDQVSVAGKQPLLLTVNKK